MFVFFQFLSISMLFSKDLGFWPKGAEGGMDVQTEGRTYRICPLCPTGHRPFEAAAQKAGE